MNTYSETEQKHMNYAIVDGHRMHVFTAGDVNRPRLVFMSGSATTAPVYDFKVLYEKLTDDFRIIVIEKFGYGYSDLYEGPCDVDSLVSFQRQALQEAGETGPYILLPHSMAGLEALRWKQKYPDEIQAIIGLDMAVPKTYLSWTEDQVTQRIRYMQKMRKLNDRGLLFWYPFSKRSLNRDEITQQRLLLRRNAMNRCYENEAKEVLHNAMTVESAGRTECRMLMFVSDGKQVSPGWIDHEKEFAKEMNAETVFLNCGHYIHYYESEKISAKIREFVLHLTV